MLRHFERVASGSHDASVHQCTTRIPTPSIQKCVTSSSSYGEDIIKLRHTPLVRVPLVGKAKFILHVFSYPLGELCRQILEYLMVLVICVLKPFVISRLDAFNPPRVR